MSSTLPYVSGDAPRSQVIEQEHESPLAPIFSLTGFQIVSTGSYVPEKVVTNADLRDTHGFDDQWIVQRTGIRERRQVEEGVATSDLCYEAARRAIDAGKIDKDRIDLIVLATFSPDMAFPATACLVQDKLELRCGAFDLQAACAGFIYALTVAGSFIRAGNSKLALVVGGDANSRITNPADPKSYPLFGDGAGAVIIGPSQGNQGFDAYHLGSQGSGGHLLSRPAGGSRTLLTAEALEAGEHLLQMDGHSIFTWAVNNVTQSCKEVMESAGVSASDIDLFIPHQANIRIINAVSDVLGIPRDRVFTNLDRFGNTSAGSIPLALDEAVRSVGIRRGAKVLISGFGAGLTFGTAVMTW